MTNWKKVLIEGHNFSHLKIHKLLHTTDLEGNAEGILENTNDSNGFIVVTKDWLGEVLRQDELGRRISRIDDVSSDATSGPGDNFTSTVHRLRVTVTLETENSHAMTLILKVAPTEGDELVFFQKEGFLETEILAYKEILPKLMKVLSEVAEPALWPKFLGMKDNYVLLSDLKEMGYSLRSRMDRLDLEHALLTVRGLAKMHAASVVLKKRGKLDVSRLRPFMHVRNTLPIRKYRAGAVQALASAIIETWGSDWLEIGQRIRDKCRFNDEIEKLAEIDESRLNVVCHGDSWTTNIFFRYFPETSGTPIAVRFIDFQLMCYNSYAFDISFLLATSLPTDLRRSCKTQILECYAQELGQFLESYKLQHLVPTMDMMQAELKRLDPFFFFALITELPVITSTIEDSLDLSKLISGDESPAQNPEVYKGHFKHDVDQELLQWAEENWF